MEKLKEIYKISKGKSTGDYYTKQTEMSGVDELNAIKLLSEDFKNRAKNDKGKEAAEELLWQAIHGAKFGFMDGKLSVKVE